jgi:hypothetical protein
VEHLRGIMTSMSEIIGDGLTKQVENPCAPVPWKNWIIMVVTKP